MNAKPAFRRALIFSLVLTCFLLGSAAVSVGDTHPLIGQPFLIDAGPNPLTNPAVAYNSNRHQFLVAYDLGNGWFRLQLLTRQGISAYDPPIVVINSGEDPAVAYNGALDQYLLVWQEPDTNGRYNIRGVRLSQDGHTAIGPIFDISTRPWHQQKPAVAFNTHPNYQDYLVVWEDVDPTWVPQHWDIYAQRVAGPLNGGDLGGQLIGGNFPVAANAFWNYEPDVAYNLNMNEYLVVYTREPAGGGAKDVYSWRVTRDGVPLPGQEHAVDSSANDQYGPKVAAYRLNQSTPYLVAFTDHWNDPAGDVRAYLVDKQGQPHTLVNLATAPGRQEAQPDVASSEGLGGYTVVWSQFDGDWDVWGRRVYQNGVTQPPVALSVPDGFVIVGHDERNPAVAGGSPVALALWEGSLSGTSDWSIAARLLGYEVNLPAVVKHR
jgi:hypothetical protein